MTPAQSSAARALPGARRGGAPWPAALAEVAELADRFEPVSLGELGDAALLDRLDTKFLLPAWRLGEALRGCVGAYRALEVRGTRLCRYATRYFDTEDLALYHAHHAGRLPRGKVRVRTYVETGDRFLELKVKTNGDRTLKARLPADGDGPPELGRLARLPLFGAVPVAPDALREVAVVRYVRLTLVRPDTAERVTVDLGLELSAGGRAVAFPALAVAEVKQARAGGSPVAAAMRRLGHRPAALSKYCLAVASLYDRAKTNRFKPILHHIDEVLRDDRGPVVLR